MVTGVLTDPGNYPPLMAVNLAAAGSIKGGPASALPLRVWQPKAVLMRSPTIVWRYGHGPFECKHFEHGA